MTRFLKRIRRKIAKIIVPCLGWTLIIGCAAEVRTEEPSPSLTPPVDVVDDNPHGGWTERMPDLVWNMKRPWVRQMAISDDGTKLAAAYYVPPINRPGTDWSVFVAQWDLKTGKRALIPGAMWPLAFAPDGQRLVMGVAPSRLERRDVMGAPAVWRLGELKPLGLIEKIEDVALDDGDEEIQCQVIWNKQGEVERLVRVTGGASRRARLFDERIKLSEDESALLPAGLYRCAARNQSRNLLAVADRRAIIEIWNTKTGALLRVLRLDDKPADVVLVAVVQTVSVFGDPERNRGRLKQLVENAAMNGARIIVLPEAAVTGYLSPDLKVTWQVDERPTSKGLTGGDPSSVAEPVPGPSTIFFSDVSRKWGVYLTVPLVEVDRRTKRYYNTLVLLGPWGEPLIHYRKRNPWPWAERSWATEGNLGNPVHDSRYGRLGVAICFDIHEQAEILAREKIDILLYSIAWVEDAGSAWFDEKLPAIAARYDYHILAANWTVPAVNQGKDWHGYGQSRVIDRTGRILAKTKNEEGVVFAEVPLAAVGK